MSSLHVRDTLLLFESVPTDRVVAPVSLRISSPIALLAFRIWKVGKRVTKISPHASVLWPVLRVVLDAGVLYSVSLLAALLCFVAKNRGHYVLLDMVRSQHGFVGDNLRADRPFAPHHDLRHSFWIRSSWRLLDCRCRTSFSAATEIDNAHHLHHVLHGDHPSHCLQVDFFSRRHASFGG